MMSEEACGATIGLPLGEGFEALYPEMDKAGINECVRVYREIFDENKALLKPQLFPGVKETLSRIHSQHNLTEAQHIVLTIFSIFDF